MGSRRGAFERGVWGWLFPDGFAFGAEKNLFLQVQKKRAQKKKWKRGIINRLA